MLFMSVSSGNWSGTVTMPIVDGEIVAEEARLEPAQSKYPIGHHVRKILQCNLEQQGDLTWLTDLSTGKSMRYSEMVANVDRIASALRRKGLKANDVVLIMASNHIELPLFFFGAWIAGGSNACLTLNLLPEDIRFRAKEVEAKFILTDSIRAPRVLEACRGIDSVREVFVIGQHEGCTPFDQLLEEPADELEEIEVDQQSLAWLMYSSGTTGVSKGILHSHQTMNTVIQSPWSKLYKGRKLLFINLMINAGGFTLVLFASLGHGQVFTMSQSSDEDLLAGIDRVKPHIISMFPSQIVWICRHTNLGSFDLSSVVFVMTTGSCLNPNYEHALFDKFPNLVLFLVSYGMTEVFSISSTFPKMSDLATLTPAKAKARHVVGSVGKLAPGNRLKIIDPVSGSKLGPGEVGEICVQTPYMLKEYFKRPEETAKTIIDGWVYTGDQGYYDRDENVFVIGRYKELIKFRMAHVVPSNIEKHLATHPAVQDAAVVGWPHDVHGELPVAFVVVRDGHSTTSDELVRYIDERVVDEERLRGGVRFTGRIPRNDLGKIVRRQLVKMLPLDPSA